MGHSLPHLFSKVPPQQSLPSSKRDLQPCPPCPLPHAPCVILCVLLLCLPLRYPHIFSHISFGFSSHISSCPSQRAWGHSDRSPSELKNPSVKDYDGVVAVCLLSSYPSSYCSSAQSHPSPWQSVQHFTAAKKSILESIKPKQCTALGAIIGYIKKRSSPRRLPAKLFQPQKPFYAETGGKLF